MATSPRNMVLIHTDEHVWSFLGCMGNVEVRTPHLDALAAGGMRFDAAYACSGVCVPSRASLLTGRYPVGHGITCNVQELAESERTLGHYLAAAGYRTGYFGKTHYGGHDDDMARDGWQESFIWQQQYNAYLRAQGVAASYPEGRQVRHPGMRYWNVGTSEIPGEHYFEKVIADQAIAFVRRHRQEPFFCFVGNIAPHGPFTPPRPYDRMYAPESLTLEPTGSWSPVNKPPAFVRWVEQNRKYVNAAELRLYLAHIYGLITLVDDQVGRIVRALQEEGLYDQTLIVFTADHGDFSSAYGIIGKSWCMDDRLMRVPLIVSHPGWRGQGRVSAALTENVDLVPTLLEYAGVAVPPAVHGRSLLGLLEGRTATHKSQVFGHNYFYDSTDSLRQTMLRQGRWKFVQSHNFKGELYDLENDPRELDNLIDRPEQAGRVRAMRDDILRWHLENCGSPVSRDAIAQCWEVRSHFYDESRFNG